MKTVLFLAFVLSQPPVVPQIVPDIIPNIPVSEEVGPPHSVEKKKVTSFASMSHLESPIIVFVGVPMRRVSGYNVAGEDAGFRGYEEKIIISLPDGKGWWKWYAMPGDSTNLEILQEVSERTKVEPSAIPFGRPSLLAFLRERRAAARRDVSDPYARRAWAPGLEFPEGMFRYRTAANTQSIFKLNDASTIDAVPREKLLMKWQVPGHMEGLTGWKSDLYAYLPQNGVQYQAMIPVKNSFGNFQDEIGYKRSFATGSRFDDVLTNTDTGKVFEHRIAEKGPDGWERFVAFRDPDQRPLGYVPPKMKDCKSCHESTVDGPGLGAYGEGLTPGGDTIVSFPIRGIE